MTRFAGVSSGGARRKFDARLRSNIERPAAFSFGVRMF